MVGAAQLAIAPEAGQRRHRTAQFVFSLLLDVQRLRADDFCLLKPSFRPTLERSVLALRLDAAPSERVPDDRHGACDWAISNNNYSVCKDMLPKR